MNEEAAEKEKKESILKPIGDNGKSHSQFESNRVERGYYLIYWKTLEEYSSCEQNVCLRSRECTRHCRSTIRLQNANRRTNDDRTFGFPEIFVNHDQFPIVENCANSLLLCQRPITQSSQHFIVIFIAGSLHEISLKFLCHLAHICAPRHPQPFINR